MKQAFLSRHGVICNRQIVAMSERHLERVRNSRGLTHHGKPPPPNASRGNHVAEKHENFFNSIDPKQTNSVSECCNALAPVLQASNRHAPLGNRDHASQQGRHTLEDGYTNRCDNGPRNIFSLTGFVLKILKFVAHSPTRAIEHFQDNKNRAIRLLSGFH